MPHLQPHAAPLRFGIFLPPMHKTGVNPTLALPTLGPGLFLTPKAGVRYAAYGLDRQTEGLDTTPHYTVPWVSVDSGVIFDRDAFLFGDSVQQTLYAMGEAALEAEPSIHGMHLRMPNKHRIPFNFKPFLLEFENDIFVTTDEPSGEISAHLQRRKD